MAKVSTAARVARLQQSVGFNVFLPVRQHRMLRALAGETRLPAAELVRLAIDLFLEQHGATPREDAPKSIRPRSRPLCGNPTHGVWCCRDAA